MIAALLIATMPTFVPLLAGSCANALPAGPVAVYRHRVTFGQGGAPAVRVRTTPIWSAGDDSNALGTIAAQTVGAAWGPVKNRPSHGIGYAVPLVDAKGRTCRGYVSQTVVATVTCDHFRETQKFAGFPKPLDTIPGPCTTRE